ncbi:MAG: hypothetical protein JO114_24765 [Planctomycetaceae bacterium]|nr:hypothetical protein [Planctomycetaceae bacterium]MBV8310622.1 hypothetical protein [Planctomycetaceae bacterium]
MARVVRRIVDASPLILLGKIGRLDLLRVGGSEVVVPAVLLKRLAATNLDEAAQEIVLASWIRIAPSAPIPSSVQAWDLGAGETAVLALALDDRDCGVILDDSDAKRGAQTLGISARETLSLVLLAKQLGEVPAARPS